MCAGKGSRKGGAGREKGRKEMRKHRPEAKRAQPVPRVSRSNGPRGQRGGDREPGTFWGRELAAPPPGLAGRQAKKTLGTALEVRPPLAVRPRGAVDPFPFL